MQQEDDLRGLAKVMEFMRAISIIFVVINIYWFCYFALHEWGFILKVVDKILLNFDRTAGLFGSIIYTKVFAVVFLALSCLGTKGVKEEKITWPKIYVFLAIGFILFFMNWWILDFHRSLWSPFVCSMWMVKFIALRRSRQNLSRPRARWDRLPVWIR